MRSIAVTVAVMLAGALGVPAASSTAVAGTAPAVAGASASPEHPLLAVSCVSSKYCVAVGYGEAADNGDAGPLADTWNGRNWAASVVKPPAGALGGTLFGVSCESPKSCFAVGDYTLPNGNFPPNDNTGALAESWNGKTWTASRPPAPAGSKMAALSGVSCVTQADCVATGVYTQANGTSAGLAELWNGHAWANVPVKLPAGSAGGALFGVSCASSKSCIAVGGYGNADATVVALAESWNGKTWTASEPSAPAGAMAAALQGASCASPTACVAVGGYTNATGYSLGLAESWNGKKWSEVPLPSPDGYGQLFGVSCVSCASSKYCLAVGVSLASDGLQGTPSSYVWNGKSWAFEKVPVPPKGSGSTATSMLQGAKCLSATDCVAVGQLDLGNSEQYQYGFSGFWNGETWKPTATA
jgi:hypothetical protein